MEATSVLTNVINAVGSLVTGVVSWVSSYLGMITQTGNEILLVFVLIPLVGLGIGILSRLFRVN